MNTRSHATGDNRENRAPKSRDQEFDEAVNRVYRRYGSDLSAFVRDVQRDMQKVQSVSQSHVLEPESED